MDGMLMSHSSISSVVKNMLIFKNILVLSTSPIKGEKLEPDTEAIKPASFGGVKPQLSCLYLVEPVREREKETYYFFILYTFENN